MAHSIFSINWRCKCYNDPVSKMFAIEDEAMTMLLLENNAKDLKLIKRARRKLSRNEKKSKHTKIDEEVDLGE